MARQIPQIPLATAKGYAFQAHIAGTDAVEFHGDCLRPTDQPLWGVQSVLAARLKEFADNDAIDIAEMDGITWTKGGFDRPKARLVWVRARCRKCENCLAWKRRLWTARAIAEVRQSMRTWFGTLTVGPERRLWAQMVADKHACQTRCESLSSLTGVERTRAIARVLAPEVTKWLKRVRKAARSEGLRYLLVVEPHEDFFPHFHLLLHERGQPVGKRLLEEKWRYGFSQFRLIPTGEAKAVGYVCKYISKSAQTRVRASRRYGQ